MQTPFQKTSLRKTFLVVGGLLACILLVSWGVWFYVTTSNAADDATKVTVEREEWYEIKVDGEPLLYYNHVDSDSIFTLLAEHRDSIVSRTTTEGRWVNRYWLLPSCRGRVVAKMDSLKNPQFDVRAFVDRNISYTQHRIGELDMMSEEMEYFFTVHSVQDAGYELVTERYEQTLREVARLEKVLQKLQRCHEADSLTASVNSLYLLSENENEDENSDKNETSKSRNIDISKSSITHSDTARFDGQFIQSLKKHSFEGAKTMFQRHYTPVLAVLKHPSCNTFYPNELEAPADGNMVLRVTPEKGVQLGEWKDGKFKGERLEYNPERIYGIDISRHQHEKGRKRFAINWKNLRITSLGTLSKKTIKGSVDYPVSFCYIKATEGTTVLNRYYASDYQQARKNGVHVGTYHFFSTKSTGAQQAKYFLKTLRINPGDFPPVLDIEPSEAAIRKMGGIEKLFQEVRVWLKIVEQRTGKRPILYISQSFVNKHLPKAPDLKRDYQVWIARYGEYKPDVHMLFWQLSPDGRVRGINTDVDINVFNGYNEKFQQFLQQQ